MHQAARQQHFPKEDPAFFVYRMPFGNISIASDGEHIVRVALGQKALSGNLRATALTNECANQLSEYMAGKRTVFDVPLSFDGSPFMRRIWSVMLEIPYSQVRTYREVAEAAGKPNSYRAVGSAVKTNPLAILIPAHRVVPESGYIDPKDTRAKLRQVFRELERRNA